MRSPVPIRLLAPIVLVGALLSAACTGAAGTPAATTPTATAPTASTTAGAVAAGGERVASTAAIADAALPRVRFATADGGTATLAVEVPPASEYEVGLSGRRTLGERGMLFSFPQGTDVGFWMLDTHIDLDIAFVDAALRVIEVQTMTAESRTVHQASARYIAGIEAPAGWFAAHGVEAGAAVTFEFDLPAATAR